MSKQCKKITNLTELQQNSALYKANKKMEANLSGLTSG